MSQRLVLPLLCMLAGCSEPPPKSQWTPSYEDNTPEHPVHANRSLPVPIPPKRPDQVEVHRGDKPTRPFTEMTAIEITCPAKAQQTATMAGGILTGTAEIVGGCSYDSALQTARARAGDWGADGIYGIETTVAENGNLVRLLAIPYRYK